MKLKLRLLILLVVAVIVVIPGTAMAKSVQDDKIIMGGTYTLKSDETLDGNLIILGGVVDTQKNSTVRGDAVLFGGTLTINGNIQGNVVGIGGTITIGETEMDSTVGGDAVLLGGTLTIDGKIEGNVVGIDGIITLGENAVIQGDLRMVAGELIPADGAVVEGQVLEGFQIPDSLYSLNRIDIPNVPRIESPFSPVWSGLWFFFRTFLWAAVAALVAIFLPNPTDRVSRVIVSQPILSGGVGLLTALVTPVVLLILAITIILIPVSLLGALILVVAWFFGRVSLGMEVGRRIGNAFHKDWPVAVDAGLGTFALVLVTDGIGSLVPCVGWIIPTLVGILGLGGVILTLFGTRAYPPEIPGTEARIPPAVEVPDASGPPANSEKIE